MRLLLPALAALISGCASISGSFPFRELGSMPSVEVQGSPMFRVLPPNAIPAVDRPSFFSLAKAREQHEPAEPVLLVEVGGDVRVYSTWALSSHEVVNDRVGGVPIAVTY